jgi:hypothetical protein
MWYVMVHYEKLDLTFQTYDQWTASGSLIPRLSNVTVASMTTRSLSCHSGLPCHIRLKTNGQIFYLIGGRNRTV